MRALEIRDRQIASTKLEKLCLLLLDVLDLLRGRGPEKLKRLDADEGDALGLGRIVVEERVDGLLGMNGIQVKIGQGLIFFFFPLFSKAYLRSSLQALVVEEIELGLLPIGRHGSEIFPGTS